MLEKTIRIKDIARMAGVSIGTVDRVLHNRGKASPEATEKVLAVLQKMDYKPNFIARNLGSNKEIRIATLMPQATDEYWLQCEKGIHDAAIDWGHFNLSIEHFLFDLNDSASFTKAANDVLLAKPDGVLIAPIFLSEAMTVFPMFDTVNIPFVTINTEIEAANAISFIGQHAFQSGRLAGELLDIRNPNRDEPASYAILHINEDIDNSAHLIEKERGFRQYFRDSGKKSSVITVSIADMSDEGFSTALDDLFQRPALRGIFVSTSKASEVAARMAGQRKISLVGYDLLSKNLEYLKKGVIDFLIHQNPRRQAMQGISALSNYLIFRKEAKRRDLFPLEVITRENVQSYLAPDL